MPGVTPRLVPVPTRVRPAPRGAGAFFRGVDKGRFVFLQRQIEYFFWKVHILVNKKIPVEILDLNSRSNHSSGSATLIPCQ